MRKVLMLILSLLVLVGCSAASNEPPPEPLALVTEAANNIRGRSTFRMEVLSSGAPYAVETDFGANVFFRQARAQYVAPDTLQGNVRLIVAGIPADVDIFSQGDIQWYRNQILTGNEWVNQPFAPGFNPQALIADDTGFQAALNALIDIEYIGESNLEDGTPAYHLTGTADGQDISALLAGIIQIQGNANVDVYIHREDRYPVRFIITLPETVTETEPDPTRWTVDVYDIDAAPELDVPGETR